MRVLFVSLIIVIVDQISKLIVKGFSIPFLNFSHKGMEFGERIPVIGDTFRFTFVENPGMAFGYYPGVDYKVFISLFSLVASIGLLIYIYTVRKEQLSLRLALAFILGGAVGNLIDRMFYGVFYGYADLFYGKVVDFLDFDFFDLNLFGRTQERFPIFNIADSAVTIGVLILLLFYKKHTTPVPAAEVPEEIEAVVPAEAPEVKEYIPEQENAEDKNLSGKLEDGKDNN